MFDQNMNISPTEIKLCGNNLIAKKIEINKKNTNNLNEGILNLNNNKNDLKYIINYP
jgi:hypothetical protein